VPIGITKDGRWLTAGDAERLLAGQHHEEKHLRAGDPEATPGRPCSPAERPWSCRLNRCASRNEHAHSFPDRRQRPHTARL
jgi:hypothetical protein